MTATYVKLPKVLSDYGLGLQTVNQAIDNLESQRAAFAVYHGQTEAQDFRDYVAFPVAWDLLGVHDELQIPRAIVQVTNEVLTPSLTRPECAGLGGIVTEFQHLGTGLYFFAVAALGAFYGEAVPIGTTSSLYLPQPRSHYSTTAGQPSGIYVSCYDMGSGSMTLADLEFSLTVYGEH